MREGAYGSDMNGSGFGPDSQAGNPQQHPNQAYQQTTRLLLGSVLFVEPEPLYNQTRVMVDLQRGGKLTGVYWPGPNVDATVAGLPAAGAISIHGLYESPLPGQLVAVGFADGNSGNPMVVERYPYAYSKRPDLQASHILPLTLKAIGPTDVVLGHHTGSFIAMRGTLPLPAEIDIVCLSVMTMTIAALKTEQVGGASNLTVGGAYSVTAGAAMTVVTGAAYSLTVGAAATVAATGAYSLTSGAAVSLTAGAAFTVVGATIGLTSSGPVNITAGGPVLVTAAPSMIVNSGVRPVAALGDLTPTFIGPMPIAATGTAVLVP